MSLLNSDNFGNCTLFACTNRLSYRLVILDNIDGMFSPFLLHGYGSYLRRQLVLPHFGIRVPIERYLFGFFAEYSLFVTEPSTSLKSFVASFGEYIAALKVLRKHLI